MSGRGWFKLHRGWMESPDFVAEPFTEREAFLWSIEQAAFEPHLQWFNGHEIAVGRGEFATSSRKMASVFRWGDKRVRLFIARMERRGKWAQRAAQEGAHLATILTVCNYAFYQCREADEGAAEGAAKGAPGAHRGRTGGAQQKKGKEREEGKEQVKASPSPALPYADAVSIWTEFASAKGWTPIAPSLPLSDDRRKRLGNILKADGLEGWRETLQRAADSEWLGGHDPPAWFNFDAAINPTKYTRIKDGNYDRTFTRESDKPKQSPWLSANARLGGSAAYEPDARPNEPLRLGPPERHAGATAS